MFSVRYIYAYMCVTWVTAENVLRTVGGSQKKSERHWFKMTVTASSVGPLLTL